jgi:hypothetical protein
MTFLLKGFGELFIKLVAYLELPRCQIARSYSSTRPAMVVRLFWIRQRRTRAVESLTPQGLTEIHRGPWPLLHMRVCVSPLYLPITFTTSF